MSSNVGSFALLSMCALSIGCGSKPHTEADHDSSESPSAGTLHLVGASESAFNPVGASVRFEAEGAELSAHPGDLNWVFNDLVQIEAESVSLTEGRNDLSLYAADTTGGLLFGRAAVWAGAYALDATVLDTLGQPVDGAEVTVALGADETISANATAAAGVAHFENLPGQTLFVIAHSADNALGLVPIAGNVGTVDISLEGIGVPSPIDNNDFHLGTEGWVVGQANVQLIPHYEPSQMSTRAGGQGDDTDLALSTSGNGAQTVSRTFETKPGTPRVTVRYRFITSEVPGGYFGTEYDDAFSVALRSQKGGGVSYHANTMNGLGLSAFDASGATEWREVSLPVSEDGDTVQVDIKVSNVADGLYDSQVVIDVVDEKPLAVTALSLSDIDGSALRFLSVGTHTYFGGSTRTHGTLTIEGADDARLEKLSLEVIQNGSVVAVGDLSSALESELLTEFGDDGQISLDTQQLLFELPSSQSAAVAVSADGSVALRVKARSSDGLEATRDFGSVGILARYEGQSRYTQRDPSEGGDDWVLPSLRTPIDSVAVKVGDISNMNGGTFAPHVSHTAGLDVDLKWDDYHKRDAAVAKRIIEQLDDPTYGSRIVLAFVTYEASDGNPFWDAIKDVTLARGVPASQVIRNAASHDTHYHFRFAAE